MNKLNKTQNTKLNSFTTTSGKIRYLKKLNYTRGESSTILKIRYQWVNNVWNTNVKTPKEKV